MKDFLRTAGALTATVTAATGTALYLLHITFEGIL